MTAGAAFATSTQLPCSPVQVDMLQSIVMRTPNVGHEEL
jgi:hypothetical protein